MIVKTLWGEEEVKSRPCIYCKEEIPLSEFPKHVAYKDNLDSRCRKCIRKYTRVRDNLRKYAPPKPEKCECCEKKPENFRSPYKWAIDHDHKTGQFRGWLCDACNIGIGTLEDSIEGIEKALRYLKKSSK